MDQAMTPDIEPASLPAARIQAAALRSAFPGYIVNVIVPAHGEKPRFELVSRDGGNPYCLISSDAREIWRELRGHTGTM
jgi:hypothetical protein